MPVRVYILRTLGRDWRRRTEVMAKETQGVRIAAVGDVHCSRTSVGQLQPLFAQAAAQADILLLCGDVTDRGLPEEAHILVKELSVVRQMPVIAVLGNH